MKNEYLITIYVTKEVYSKNKYGIFKWTKERKFLFMKNYTKKFLKASNGITLIALVITIVLNCSYLAMERMLKKELILKII